MEADRIGDAQKFIAIGTSAADAGLAQARVQREQQVTTLRALELQVTAQVRDAGRQVETTLKRVEATRKAREFGEKRYDAEQKRINVGLSTTFQLIQAQRDYFGAHTYERIDQPRGVSFHLDWSKPDRRQIKITDSH